MNVVFGSSGVIGSRVLDALAARGARARAVYRSRRPRSGAIEPACVDLSTGRGLGEALAGAEAVFLATGDMADQVAAETRVIEAAARAGVRKIVKLSILSAESEAFYLARVHRAIERRLESADVPYTILRPGGFMQNFITYYGHALRTEGVLRLPCAAAEENPVDARDIASVAAVCLGSDACSGRTLDLCGPEPMTYAAMVGVIARVSGRDLRYEPISDDAFREAMLPFAATPDHADGLVDMFRFHRQGLAPKRSAAVQEVTGSPPRSFERFVRDNVAAWAR